MNTQILEDIGLSTAEIKTYLALLEVGSSTAGPIIEKSGLQSSVVHMTLGKLVGKGFVSFVQEGKRKHYQAANPKHILEYLKEKQDNFSHILPELLAKQHQEKLDVTVFRGIRGIKEILYDLLEAGGTEHHTIGSTKESLMIPIEWWLDYHRKRAAKGVNAKLLFNESLKSWKAEKLYERVEVRYTNAGFEPLTETIIRNDKIGLIIWTEKPIGILIHNKTAAESYDKYFTLLWQAAGKR